MLYYNCGNRVSRLYWSISIYHSSDIMQIVISLGGSLRHYLGGSLLLISYFPEFLVEIICIRYRVCIGKSLWVVFAWLNKWDLMPLGWKSLNSQKIVSDCLSMVVGEEPENLNIGKTLRIMLYASCGHCGPIYVSCTGIFYGSRSAPLW